MDGDGTEFQLIMAADQWSQYLEFSVFVNEYRLEPAAYILFDSYRESVIQIVVMDEISQGSSTPNRFEFYMGAG